MRESRTIAAAAQNRTESLRSKRSGITALRRAESIKLTAITMSAPICFTMSTGNLFLSRVDEFHWRAGRSRGFPRPSRPCWCPNVINRDAMVLEPLQEANVGHTQGTTTFKCELPLGTGRRQLLGIESPAIDINSNASTWGRRLKSVRGYTLCGAVAYVLRDDNYSGLGRKFFTLACKNSWANTKI